MLVYILVKTDPATGEAHPVMGGGSSTREHLCVYKSKAIARSVQTSKSTPDFKPTILALDLQQGEPVE